MKAEDVICGWGATCDGVCTGKPWVPEESQWHQGSVAFHTLKYFTRDKRSIIVLLGFGQYLYCIVFVNNMGRTVSPNLKDIVGELWLWVKNAIADVESQDMKDHSDRMLNPHLFSAR